MATKPAKPEHVNLNLLPPQLRQLVRVMGDAAAFRLVEHYGGVRIKIPKRASPEHQLAELLGPAAFAALVEHYGGLETDLPKYDSVLRQARHQRVYELLRYYSIRKVARMTNYTARQVINLKHGAGDLLLDPQGDMFPELLDGTKRGSAA